MMKPSLRGPAFTPWDRYKLLALALRNVAPEHLASTTSTLFTTCRVVMEHATGHGSYAAAVDALEDARRLTHTARLGAPQPQAQATAA